MTSGTKRSRERGAANLIEAAFTLPVLIIFVLGVMDFSRAVYAYHFVAEAAREATRYASVRGSACKQWTNDCPADHQGSDVASYVQTLEPSGIPFTNPPSYTTACTGASAAGCISVVSSYPGQSGGWPVGCTSGNNGENPGCPVSVTVTYTFAFVFQSHFSLGKIALPSTSEMVITQ
jgi:Flp pilus assembly protein TadG